MVEVEIVKREIGIILPEYPSLNLEPLANVINQIRDITELKHSLEQQKKELCDVIMEDGAKTTPKLLEIADVVTQNLSYKHVVKLKRCGSRDIYHSAEFTFFPKGVDIALIYFFRFVNKRNDFEAQHHTKLYLRTNRRKGSYVDIRFGDGSILDKDLFSVSIGSFFEKAAREYVFKGYDDLYKKFFELYHKMPEILTEAIGKLNVDIAEEMSKVQNESRLLQ